MPGRSESARWCGSDRAGPGDAMAGDGVDLIARIRSQVRNMPPILALTAAVAESELADLYDAGADDVMFKPLRIAVFAARVQRLARRVYPPGAADGRAEGRRICHRRGRAPAPSQCAARQAVESRVRPGLVSVPQRRPSGQSLDAGEGDLGQGLGVDSKTVDTHIYRLRVKLRLQPENGLQLASVYAQGFRLIQVVTLS